MRFNSCITNIKNGVDYDGSYGYQCVDAVQYYLKNCLQVTPKFNFNYAYEVYTKDIYGDRLQKIPNKLLNYPQKGDIIIWGKERNGYAGHIAIVLKATRTSITVVEQNFDGKGKTRTKADAYKGVREHTYTNYKNVLGWLRNTYTTKNVDTDLLIRGSAKSTALQVGKYKSGDKFAVIGWDGHWKQTAKGFVSEAYSKRVVSK